MSALSQIVQDATDFQQAVSRLASISPYYPQIITEKSGGTVYLSTKVRIERGATWYAIHCLHSYNEEFANRCPDLDIPQQCTQQLMASAHDITHLYIVDVSRDSPDRLQLSEAERLSNLHQRMV